LRIWIEKQTKLFLFVNSIKVYTKGNMEYK